MDYEFSPQSKANLDTADCRLALIARKVIKVKDHSILIGHRNEQDQNDKVASGNSELNWPDSKHNSIPSKAIDVQTYPRPQQLPNLVAEQYYLLGLYVGIGEALGIKLRTGADWDRDGEVLDNDWDDLFHIELAD